MFPMKKIQSDKPENMNHEGPDNTAPYAVSRMAPAFELVDLAREIATADEALAQNLNGKLTVIAEQIRHLQEQAKHILDDAHKNQQLHRATCQFKRIPGKIYHLYEKPSNERYFSMLAPEEWGSSSPHKFVGSFRLETDMSWTSTEDIAKQEEEKHVLRQMLEFRD